MWNIINWSGLSEQLQEQFQCVKQTNFLRKKKSICFTWKNNWIICLKSRLISIGICLNVHEQPLRVQQKRRRIRRYLNRIINRKRRKNRRQHEKWRVVLLIKVLYRKRHLLKKQKRNLRQRTVACNNVRQPVHVHRLDQPQQPLRQWRRERNACLA